MRVRYSRRALAQIAEAIGTIAEEAPSAAGEMAHRFETVAGLLGRHPAIGRPTDLKDVRVFSLRPYPYLIFYRDEPGRITILRVRHMARKEDWRSGR